MATVVSKNVATKMQLLSLTPSNSQAISKPHLESVKELQCQQIPLKKRISKHCSHHLYDNSYDKLFFDGEIPLHIHININAPPSTPTAPFSTPHASPYNSSNNSSDEESSENDDYNKKGVSEVKISVTPVPGQKVAPIDTCQNNVPPCYKSGFMKPARESPQQALRIKSYYQSRLKKKGDDQNKDRNLKTGKCRAIKSSEKFKDFNYVSNEDTCKTVPDRRFTESSTRKVSESKSTFVTSYSAVEEISRSHSFDSKVMVIRKIHSSSVKNDAYKNYYIPASTSYRRVADSLLPQNQHQKNAVTICDVLQSLDTYKHDKNTIKNSERNVQRPDESYKPRTPTLSKTELQVWSDNNSKRSSNQSLGITRGSSTKTPPQNKQVRNSTSTSSRKTRLHCPKKSSRSKIVDFSYDRTRSAT